MPGYQTSKKPYASNPHGGEHNYAGKTMLTGGTVEGMPKPKKKKKAKKSKAIKQQIINDRIYV